MIILNLKNKLVKWLSFGQLQIPGIVLKRNLKEKKLKIYRCWHNKIIAILRRISPQMCSKLDNSISRRLSLIILFQTDANIVDQCQWLLQPFRMWRRQPVYTWNLVKIPQIWYQNDREHTNFRFLYDSTGFYLEIEKGPKEALIRSRFLLIGAKTFVLIRLCQRSVSYKRSAPVR